MRGRNTTVIGVRVPVDVYARIRALSDKQKQTVSEWCKNVLARAAGLPTVGNITHHKKL